VSGTRRQYLKLLLIAALATLCLPGTLTVTHSIAVAGSLHDSIREAQRKVVKIYGAGGVSGLEAYQTGILISAEGHVLTVQSYVLDTDDLAVVLDDGRKFTAEILGVDPVRELAVLKLPVEDDSLPHFDLAAAPLAKIGERVLAVSNLFNIAGGDEPVSALQGVVSAISPLDARRGAHQASFRGKVYIVDAAANNPGAAGGALVNWRGELLGLLGKELRSSATGAWLHYAIPVDQFVASVETMEAGRTVDDADSNPSTAADPLSLAEVGIVLIPDILPRTPPYIDSVVADSAAARAGLRPDDLLVLVEGEPTASCSAVVDQVTRRENFDDVRISVLRDGELVEVTLNAEDAEPLDESNEDEGDSVEGAGYPFESDELNGDDAGMEELEDAPSEADEATIDEAVDADDVESGPAVE
jgi:S1-C subfamily serine protease